MLQKILKLLKTPPTKDTQIAKDTHKKYLFFGLLFSYRIFVKTTPKNKTYGKR